MRRTVPVTLVIVADNVGTNYTRLHAFGPLAGLQSFRSSKHPKCFWVFRVLKTLNPKS